MSTFRSILPSWLKVCLPPHLRPVGAALILAFSSAPSLYALPDNLGFGLKELAEDYQTARQASGAKASARDEFAALLAARPLARGDDATRVKVEVYLDGTVPLDKVIAACEALGCTTTAKVDWYRHGVFSAWLPLESAGTVGNTPGVSSVLLSLRPQHFAGKVPGTGAKVLNALKAQTNYNVLGAGITVGVLSDSYNFFSQSSIGASQDIASGDLPGPGNPEGYPTPVNVLKDFVTNGYGQKDEGRAMLQIIHDVAPAAQLAFYTGELSETDFAAGIVALANTAGCQVICDDLTYYDEPMFSDGIVAQAVDRVTAQGVSYFASAGNDGNSGWQGTFAPVNNDSTAQALLLAQGGITYSSIPASESAVTSKYHSFGTDANGKPILVQKVFLPAAYGLLIFQWDDPSGVMVNGTRQITTDFDILVFSVDPSTGAATYVTGSSGTGSNFATNQPVEVTGGLVPGTQYEFVLVRTNRPANAGGPARDQATHLRWDVRTDGVQIIADFVGPNSVNSYGHNCAAGCAGTAAYVYDDSYSAANTVYTPLVEPYSSNGPATIYFDSAGNRLATPVVRKQPLLAAVDGVSTTFFPPGSGNDSDGDGYPNFFGTSAAAPHAAGVAALVLSAARANNITLSPADVKTLLTSTTQGQSDQDPSVSNATAGPTRFSARDRETRNDPQAFTITYNGAAGTTLNKLVFDLSPLPGNFRTSTYAVTVGAAAPGTPGGGAPAITSSTVTAADGVSAGTTTLTLNLSNFTPGSTLSFGVARTVTVAGGNIYTGGDQLAGATVKATDSTGATSIGTLANTFSKKWNVKSGYGLIDANAALGRLLGH